MKLVQDNKTHKITANESQSVGVLSLMAVPMFWCAPLSGGCREELRAFGGEFLRESRGAYVADSGADTRCVPIGVTCALFSCLYDAFRTSSLRGLRSENWSTRVFVGFDLRTLFYFSPHRFATMTASGCPCFVLRAASFVCRLIASQLALAISFRFEVRTPCCGHGPDHRRRYSHRCLPQPLSPNLLQIVLLEVGAIAEEGFVGFRGGFALVFRCCQLDSADVVGDLEEAIIGEETNSFLRQPLQEFESESRNACAVVRPDQHALSCAFSNQFATMTASGCPCLELWAAPFVCRLIASQLALAISFRFGARTPCCGHGLDHRRRQSHRRSGKLEQLNNQVHGRITSFRGRRRCQHTGLTPLTLHDCIINIRTNVPKYRVNSSRKCERRAA